MKNLFKNRAAGLEGINKRLSEAMADTERGVERLLQGERLALARGIGGGLLFVGATGLAVYAVSRMVADRRVRRGRRIAVGNAVSDMVENLEDDMLDLEATAARSKAWSAGSKVARGVGKAGKELGSRLHNLIIDRDYEAERRFNAVEVEASVMDAIEHDPILSKCDMRAGYSDGGVVDIWGIVGNMSERERAIRVVQGVHGVVTVIPHIDVDEAAGNILEATSLNVEEEVLDYPAFAADATRVSKQKRGRGRAKSRSNVGLGDILADTRGGEAHNNAEL